MTDAWPIVPLSSVLQLNEDAVPVEASTVYGIAGVYSFGRGLFRRNDLLGSATTYKHLHRLHAGQLVLSQLKGWEGAMAVVRPEFDGLFLSPQFRTFSANVTALDLGWLTWFFRSPQQWSALKRDARGMGARRDSVSPSQLLKLEIPLPTLAEQRRIVARLDALASSVDEAGTLHASSAAAITLLPGCFVEALLDQWRSRGVSERPLGTLLTAVDYGTSEKTSDDNNGLPILRMGNIQDGRLDLRNLKYLSLGSAARSAVLLKPGDILVNRTNSAELVGKCAEFDAQGDYGFASYIIRIRLDLDKAHPGLVAAIINSPAGRKYMFRSRKQMTGQANVNSKTLRSMPIVLPPLDEQMAAFARLSSLRASIDAASERSLATNRTMSALLPSLQNMAFRGGL